MEKMCHHLAVAHFNLKDDPIAPFNSCNKNLLLSSLNQPKQTFGGKELYPTLIDKAAILYYSLIQNHVFPNGNKRIATATLLVFLFINGYWLRIGQQELADKAIEIAKSGETDPPKKIDKFLPELKKWLNNHLETTIK